MGGLKTCIECGAAFARNPAYGRAQWQRARFCGNPCSAAYRGRGLKGKPFSTPKRPPIRPVSERFWEQVGKTDGCWNWTGYTSTNGYGRMTVGPRGEGMVAVHRVSLVLHGIDIPKGYEVDHLCLNKRCVRPDHLEPVTGAENRRRAVRVRDAKRVAA